MDKKVDDKRKHISQMSNHEIKVLYKALYFIKYFNFTTYSLDKVKFRKISRYNIIGAIKNGRIIEAHNNVAGDVRILVRCNINNESVCVVISLRNELVVTAYINNINDNHVTLDTTKYKWTAYITNNLIRSILNYKNKGD